jgi:DNA-3-methyladenine glycosylase I
VGGNSLREIECRSCTKSINEDSVFCKYCGAKNTTIKASLLDDKKLASIFQRISKTLISNSAYTEKEFEDKFNIYKSFENRTMSNNDYYRIIVDIVFYSGFRASTVEKYIDVIHAYFPDYKVVRKYDAEQIEQIKNDPKMLRNKSKINACVKNAEKIEEIAGKFGSVQAYIDSFEPKSNDDCLFKLKKDLEKNFSFLGEVTSYHFMTDIGLNVLKPDRVISRIFYRLGLIENENDLYGAVKVGRAFSKATDQPIRYIDVIFVLFGQLNLGNFDCICSEKNPKCQKCGIVLDCNYGVVNGA